MSFFAKPVPTFAGHALTSSACGLAEILGKGLEVGNRNIGYGPVDNAALPPSQNIVTGDGAECFGWGGRPGPRDFPKADHMNAPLPPSKNIVTGDGAECFGWGGRLVLGDCQQADHMLAPMIDERRHRDAA